MTTKNKNTRHKKNDELVFVGAWISRDDSNELKAIAKRKAKETGGRWSKAHLIRHIIRTSLENAAGCKPPEAT